MPLYEFKCLRCGERYEKLVRKFSTYGDQTNGAIHTCKDGHTSFAQRIVSAASVPTDGTYSYKGPLGE